MVANKDALEQEDEEPQCQNSVCKKPLAGVGIEFNGLWFCPECYDLSAAVSWLFMKSRYDIPDTLVSFYVA